MAKVQSVARIVLGLIYFIFGGMGLAMALGLYHAAFPPLPPKAEAFMTGMMGSGYFFILLKMTETTCGFLLLTGIAVPLALVIIASVTLNIYCFNLFLMPGLQNLLLPSVMVFCQITAMSAYWHKYRQLLAGR
ncbi:MAG: acyltransferase [Candidatus Omnitrophica bacterium]|nr:acyltransferase [Candidatus Omnitrophota bacterium]MDE2222711.1 acyltransferase [Candidatus Omnitrophota bacterium]